MRQFQNFSLGYGRQAIPNVYAGVNRYKSVSVNIN